MLALALTLALSQVETTSQSSVDDQRTATRFRGGIAASGGVLYLRAGAFIPVFGIAGELGVVLNDRVTLSVRPQFATNIGYWLLGLTPGVDYAL